MRLIRAVNVGHVSKNRRYTKIDLYNMPKDNALPISPPKPKL